MRKFSLATLASLIVVAALPAHATLADRKSDEPGNHPVLPAPYSGQVVIRGEVRTEQVDKEAALPAPFSGHIVIRGEVKPASRG